MPKRRAGPPVGGPPGAIAFCSAPGCPGGTAAPPFGYPNGGVAVPLGQPVALQKTIALGSHLTVWPARRFGIEATFAYAPSGVTMACRVPDCNAGHAVTASARIVVPAIGVTSSRCFYLGAGVGLVALGGTAY